jgi:hypothetical protein
MFFTLTLPKGFPIGLCSKCEIWAVSFQFFFLNFFLFGGVICLWEVRAFMDSPTWFLQ